MIDIEQLYKENIEAFYPFDDINYEITYPNTNIILSHIENETIISIHYKEIFMSNENNKTIEFPQRIDFALEGKVHPKYEKIRAEIITHMFKNKNQIQTIIVKTIHPKTETRPKIETWHIRIKYTIDNEYDLYYDFIPKNYGDYNLFRLNFIDHLKRKKQIS